ncbi:SRPBCC family protein [Natronosporangium hydrolyticum]|uniref:SRPBCC family protein n=2 Tax=Natronosporangium hydrolyticum TaxID=2811111 RepID=A0A895YGQ0_9ACTN|nr:SRPBCC family protein [Natronosporangium hydrolyticum]
MSQLPTDELKQELRELLKAVAKRAVSSLTNRVGGGVTEKLGLDGAAADGIAGAGAQAVKKAGGAAVKKAGGKVVEGVQKAGSAVGGGGGGGGGSGGGAGKVTNIVEQIDVGVPINVAYDQWTRFTDFPSFMKKVENVEQESDTELKWRGRVLWSSRDWKSTILDQIPDERIIWRSEGAKGYVDGAVTFHELSPTLTRILLVLEYYPNGFFEKTGNLWRAQGRRVRLELKHFRRHVMTQTILHPDEVEGWRGEIHDSEVQSQSDEEESGGEESGGEENGGEENGGEENGGEENNEENGGEQAGGEQASEEAGEDRPANNKRRR